MSDEILLIDLSSILYPTWHMTSTDPDPNATSTQTVARVRALASGHPHVAICIDSRTSHRKALDPTYKANRESNAPLQHQMRLAIETLKTDGFPVWGADGFEADDVIASAAHVALTKAGAVAVATADKDLLQLVQATEFGSVSVKSLKDSSWIDRDAVKAKLGVWPEQVLDYLCLVGDAIDNVKGCPGIGPKWAAKILADYKSLDNLWAAFDKGATPDITANFRTKLQEFRANVWPTTKALITLRTDVPIAFEEIFAPRVPKDEDVAVFSADDIQWGNEMHNPETGAGAQDRYDSIRAAEFFGRERDKAEMLNRPTRAEVATVRDAAQALFTPADARAEIDAVMPSGKGPSNYEGKGPSNAEGEAGAKDRATRGSVVRDDALQGTGGHRPDDAPASAVSGGAGRVRRDPSDGDAAQGPDRSESLVRRPEIVVEYEKALEPRSLNEAITLAKHLFDSRLFSAWGSAQAVLSILLAGREISLGPMASLRAFDNIQGKPTMKADLIRALVMRSGKAQYLRCSERTATRATFITHRIGDPEPVTLTYTIEEAQMAGLVKPGSGWTRNPHDMLVARAGAKLCRLVYPDICHGLIGSEEIDG